MQTVISTRTITNSKMLKIERIDARFCAVTKLFVVVVVVVVVAAAVAAAAVGVVAMTASRQQADESENNQQHVKHKTRLCGEQIAEIRDDIDRLRTIASLFHRVHPMMERSIRFMKTICCEDPDLLLIFNLNFIIKLVCFASFASPFFWRSFLLAVSRLLYGVQAGPA